MSGFRRIGLGAIILGLLLASLFLAGKNIVTAADQAGPDQTTPTSTQTTSPLPTPTSTPSPTQTPTATVTPTVTPTLAPNQLDCFAASRPDNSSMLLAWHIGSPTDVAAFALWRAVVISPTQQSGFIENSKLQQPIPAPAAQSLGSSTLYTTTDTGIETGKSYVYRLDVTGKSGGSLGSFTAYSPAPGATPDNEICDPNRTSPTATPTASLTPIIFPTSTATPPHTATPTWTWTATNTPTPTWTFTPLPTDPFTPTATETFTPIPSDTPLPPTETPSPTFTITPTFTPDIQPPTPAQSGFDTQPPPMQDVPGQETPTPEPPVPMLQQIDGQPTPPPLETEGPTPVGEQTQTITGEEEDTVAQSKLPIAQVQREAAAGPARVADFRQRLIPSSRANLFRYALFGVAGLAFVGALAFLAAGIGLMRGKD